jgi:hypothetical protein
MSKKKNRTLRGAAQVIVYNSNCNNGHDEIQVEISGKTARSLQLLIEYKTGLTRMEALDRHGVLSLTQHVHTMRHDYGLQIETEWIIVDEKTKYGRYHLISKVSFPSEYDGGKS